LATKLGWRYTRYADDLTFSRPAGAPDTPPDPLIKLVTQIAAAEGFTIKAEKTRLARSGRRQTVTGLVVNRDLPPRAPRKLRRQIRAALHNLTAGKPLPEGETLAQLQGYAAYIYMTDPKLGKKFLEQIGSAPTGA
jgi:RNA-directed DNA polymerase